MTQHVYLQRSLQSENFISKGNHFVPPYLQLRNWCMRELIRFILSEDKEMTGPRARCHVLSASGEGCTTCRAWLHRHLGH